MRGVESAALSDLLKAIRRQQGWTQEELAKRLGVTRPQACQYESGRSDMPASKLLALLHEVGYDLTSCYHGVVMAQTGPRKGQS